MADVPISEYLDFSSPLSYESTNIHIYERAFGDLVTRKNLSLEIPAGPEIRPIRSSAIKRTYRGAAKRVHARASERTLSRMGRRTNNERLIDREEPQIHSKFPDDRVGHFARPHPVVANVRPYTSGPDKLSVLAVRKVAFRIPIVRKQTEGNNISEK